jgi:hypothetical protein
MACEASLRAAESSAIDMDVCFRDRYSSAGYVSPAGRVDAALAAKALDGLKRWTTTIKPTLPSASAFAHNHTCLPWLRELAAHAPIVDAVAACFGCDTVHLYSSHLLPREAGHSLATDSGIDWHEDGYLYMPRLQPVDLDSFTTAFVALSTCDERHGCLQTQPLGGGDATINELAAGEFSLHGPWTRHRALLNASSETRYCVALRYISGGVANVQLHSHGPDYTLCVRGKDTRQTWMPLPPIEGEWTKVGQGLRLEMAVRRGTRGGFVEQYLASRTPLAPLPAPPLPPAQPQGLGEGGGSCEQWEVVHSLVNMRAAPRLGAMKVGELRRGDQLIAAREEGGWVLVAGKVSTDARERWVLVDGRDLGLGELLSRVDSKREPSGAGRAEEEEDDGELAWLGF